VVHNVGVGGASVSRVGVVTLPVPLIAISDHGGGGRKDAGSRHLKWNGKHSGACVVDEAGGMDAKAVIRDAAMVVAKADSNSGSSVNAT